MDFKVAALAAAGLLVTLALYFLIDIYFAGIVFILIAVIVMSLLIMQDSSGSPDIVVEFRPDAKAVILKNIGNATAVKVHAALVPLNIDFDVPPLEPDSAFEYMLAAMVTELRVLVSYEDGQGRTFAKNSLVNALEGPYDPLKPMFPLFRWK